EASGVRCEIERVVVPFDDRLLNAVERAVVRHVAARRQGKPERESNGGGDRGLSANVHRDHFPHLRLKPGVAASARRSPSPGRRLLSAASSGPDWSIRPISGACPSPAARGIGRFSSTPLCSRLPMNCSARFGARKPSVGSTISLSSTGFTRYGVTTMTSSVWPLRKFCDLNRLPMIGKSPAPGSLSIVLWALLLIRPAIMKLWPEPSSTVVSARRTVSAGMVKLLIVTAPWLDSSDTSGRTRIEIRPLASTVGV